MLDFRQPQVKNPVTLIGELLTPRLFFFFLTVEADVHPPFFRCSYSIDSSFSIGYSVPSSFVFFFTNYSSTLLRDCRASSSPMCQAFYL